MATSLACPSCSRPISSSTQISGQRQVLTKYHNEGGLQNDLDIFPLIVEEAYLEANPTARPARAFLTMCGEGDVAGIVELLKAIEEDSDEGDMSTAELLRYQDPLDSMKTGLHLAIEKSQQEVLWLLLWLASDFPSNEFPREIIQAAVSMSVGRGTASPSDVRSLRNTEGQTAGDVARSIGITWAGMI